MELNDYQKPAVLDEHNACLVRANVGSGKQRFLSKRSVIFTSRKKSPWKI